MKSETYTDPDLISTDFCKAREVLVQVFTSLNTAKEINDLIDRIKARVPHAKILGATAGAKIQAGRLSYQQTLLTVSTFCCSEVHTGIVFSNKNLFEDAFDLTRRLRNSSVMPPKAAIVFSEGLRIDGEVLLRGISEVEPNLLIAGGMASDDHRFKETFVFTEEGCTNSGFAIALLFGEALKVYNSFNFNWVGLGRTFKVTKSRGNRVWELDHTPIIEIYKRYLGDQIAQMLPDIGLEFPMIITDKAMPVARAVMVKHDDGSLSFAGSIEEGTMLQFGFGDSEGIMAGANVDEEYFIDKPVESLFAYSCIARLSLVGDDIEQETLQLQRFAMTNGFYTYGEFYHAPCEKCNLFLNQTMTVLGLSEGEIPPLRINPLEHKHHARTSLHSSAMSHFVQQITADMEKAIEAEKQSKEIMLHQSRQATIGETIEIIAHQWRQPLNIIALALQDIYIKGELSLLTPELLEAQYEKANSALQYLSQTIDDFRDFMRPENGLNTFALESVLNETSVLVTGLLKKHHITLDNQARPNLIIHNRKNALLQILLILVYNAIDAISEHRSSDGRISISAIHQNDEIVLEISDNGGGIPQKNLTNVFEPYFTTKGKKHGTGMGLYIASSLAKHYLQGDLSVLNREEGACFTLRIATSLDLDR
ncbi:FIST N-terminal domain-containing protein [Sulfurimonas sp. HSL3-7]|uniref:FIST N-terminal domain-containing protein n=1 Tax=Sulfonitrofixus jiaomeiensis TaxID=3131938 RepID=UPI0031F8DAE2